MFWYTTPSDSFNGLLAGARTEVAANTDANRRENAALWICVAVWHEWPPQGKLQFGELVAVAEFGVIWVERSALPNLCDKIVGRRSKHVDSIKECLDFTATR